MGGTNSKEYNLDDHGHSDRQTFDDYIAGDKFNDLSGKVVAITGTSTGGLGLYAGEVAIKKGAKLLLCLNRKSGSAKKGEEELVAIATEAKSSTKIQAVECDLQDLESVKKAGEEINQIAASNDGLDVLILNAGVMALKDYRTKDGFEVQMQTNQLSHFLLTKTVWKSIVQASKSRGEARVVTHTSGARKAPARALQKQFFEKSEGGTLGGDKTWFLFEMLGYDGPWQRYHQTKLSNSAFAMALHDKLKAAGITNVISTTGEPGVASSNLQVTTTKDGVMSSGLAKFFVSQGHSAPDGSLGISMCAFGKDVKSGSLYEPESGGMKGPPVARVEDGVELKQGTDKDTINPDNKENVWKWCEEAVGPFDVTV